MKLRTKYVIFFSTLMVIALIARQFTIPQPSVNAAEGYSFPPNQEIAVWEWRTPSYFKTSTIRSQYFSQLSKEGVNTVYVNIKNFLEVYSSQRDRELKIANFNRQSADFIAAAKSYGIKVHALAGAADWFKAEKSDNVFILLNHILDYNYKNTYKFAGINFDIEYYTLSDYKTNRAAYASQYLNMVDRMIATIKSSRHSYMNLGLTIPFWIDKVNANNPSIVYKNTTATPGVHLMNLLSRHSQTYLSIMAYRNFYDGADGTVNLVKDELDYIKSKNYSTRVIVGQETYNVLPAFITYYGKTKQNLKYNTLMIAQAYANNDHMAGFAIHTADSFLKLAP
ncbi:MAG TPA: hypothetical protein VEC17_02080 [Candidatus Binatia bacterium]|nr:hypothetical protein [Candidatus Binatia bacterium]